MEFTNAANKEEKLVVQAGIVQRVVWLDILGSDPDPLVEFGLSPMDALVLAQELQRVARMV